MAKYLLEATIHSRGRQGRRQGRRDGPPRGRHEDGRGAGWEIGGVLFRLRRCRRVCHCRLARRHGGRGCRAGGKPERRRCRQDRRVDHARGNGQRRQEGSSNFVRRPLAAIVGETAALGIEAAISPPCSYGGRVRGGAVAFLRTRTRPYARSEAPTSPSAEMRAISWAFRRRSFAHGSGGQRRGVAIPATLTPTLSRERERGLRRWLLPRCSMAPISGSVQPL